VGASAPIGAPALTIPGIGLRFRFCWRELVRVCSWNPPLLDQHIVFNLEPSALLREYGVYVIDIRNGITLFLNVIAGVHEIFDEERGITGCIMHQAAKVAFCLTRTRAARSATGKPAFEVFQDVLNASLRGGSSC
jgi:hypothetical protein